MSTFRVRYKMGQAPAHADEDDCIEVVAGSFATAGAFIDFYDGSDRTMQGLEVPAGAIVLRVAADLIADIHKV